MTTNPSSTRKATPKAAAKKPAVKATIGKGGPHRPETVIELAPKARKRSAKAAVATMRDEIAAKPEPKGLSDVQTATLVQLRDELATATEAFETAVVQLLQDGASPTHVGKAVDLGNSSIRRIGWRHGWAAK